MKVDSFDDLLKNVQTCLEEHIIEETKNVLYNFNCLDNYDFSDFLTEGRSLLNIVENIEIKYDREFKERFGIYMFDNLEMDIIKEYFEDRYNVKFQEYIDWVVRKENGINSKARRRIENRS